MFTKKQALLFWLSFILLTHTGSAQVSIEGEFIFQADAGKHGHTHASSIIQCPNGDFLACWYEGKTDRSEDVRIQAARLKRGEIRWSETFLLADTPTLSDNNPCLFIDSEKRLWLIYYTLLGSPEEAWDTAFLRYKIASDYEDASRPISWDIERDLPVKPNHLDETVKALCKMMIKSSFPEAAELCEEAQMKLKNQLARKLGWTTRARPLTLSSGTILLPMASEIFGISMMALTSDGGQTWTFPEPPLGFGVEQPSVFERKDGTLVAYMRDSSPANRIRTSTSNDGGLTWSPIENSIFPNPGSGLEVLRLASGRIILIYNDCTQSPRNSLAVSLSDDEGRTWRWTRRLEHKEGEARFDYPSIIQAQDGRLHATYSVDVKTIKHVIFSEAWIESGTE
ncbi:exo-alpha-sialidase [candidate division KSB1 bacterium]|nr:exo-alpha-sialidase [candidate division KSB1 bacterium]